MQISRKLWQLPPSAYYNLIARQNLYKYLTLGVLTSGIINILGPIAVLMLLESEKKNMKSEYLQKSFKEVKLVATFPVLYKKKKNTLS